MKCIIRTHVKHHGRLKILADTIKSAKKAGFSDVLVVDDQSPLVAEVFALCLELNARHFLTQGTPGTKNGLYWSMKMDDGDDLHICDDVELAWTNWSDLPPFADDWGVLSYFAAYPRQPSDEWWHYPTPNFYAALACRFHPMVRGWYIAAREAVSSGEAPETQAQDDILLKEILTKMGKQIWNTGWDFAQHTGTEDSTFEGPHDCAYRSKFFIGERSQR